MLNPNPRPLFQTSAVTMLTPSPSLPFHSAHITRRSCFFPFPIFKGYSLLPSFFRSFYSSTTSCAFPSAIYQWPTNSRPLSSISSSPRNLFSMFSNKFLVTAVNTLLTSLEVAVNNWCSVFHYHQQLTKLAVGQLLRQNGTHTLLQH